MLELEDCYSSFAVDALNTQYNGQKWMNPVTRGITPIAPHQFL